MTFGLSGAALAGVAIGGATLISGLAQADASRSAASTQAGAAQAGISEQKSQFDKLQALLQPYVNVGAPAITGLQPYAQAGVPAFEQQQALIGLRGPEAERAAIERITSGARFQEMAQQGEEALLQNASATGGLRGGNIQGALAQYRPALLSSLIEQQYGKLGGLADIGRETQTNLAKIGQASAAGVGAQGVTTGANISALLSHQGAAQAGADIAQGRAFGAIPSGIAGGLGIYRGLGGTFGGSGVTQAMLNQANASSDPIGTLIGLGNFQ
jgi:hypothetical protein